MSEATWDVAVTFYFYLFGGVLVLPDDKKTLNLNVLSRLSMRVQINWGFKYAIAGNVRKMVSFGFPW